MRGSSACARSQNGLADCRIAHGSTCESLRKRRDVGDGRLRGTFLQTKAETGRLAMDEPSLHNVPHARQFTLGSAARKHTLALRAAFAPARGRVLLLADYRQFELRMMLHFAGDAALTARLVGPDAPCDPFKGLAALWCRKAVDAVTEDERAWAKTVSYGLLYGKAVSTMAFDLDIDVAQAQIMVDAFKESLPAVRAWLKRCVDEAREQDLPGVTTIAGRRRMLPDLIAVRAPGARAGRKGRRADACTRRRATTGERAARRSGRL
jgi:DNA polymerase-1